MVVVASRGGDYGPGTPIQTYDFQEPYLRAIFGFVGITDMQFIIAQPMDIDPKLAEERLREATVKAKAIAENF